MGGKKQPKNPTLRKTGGIKPITTPTKWHCSKPWGNIFTLCKILEKFQIVILKLFFQLVMKVNKNRNINVKVIEFYLYYINI